MPPQLWPSDKWQQFFVTIDACARSAHAAGVAQAEDGAPAIFSRSVDLKMIVEQAESMRGWLPFSPDCPARHMSPGNLGREEIREEILGWANRHEIGKCVPRLLIPTTVGEHESRIVHDALSCCENP